MPIYEYRCTDCGFQDEFLQKLSEAPLTQCPSCGKPSFQKLLSAAGFQLKGSGWYATDFKGGGSSKQGEGKKSADKGGEPKTEAKTESKSEGKAEAKTESKSEAPVSK